MTSTFFTNLHNREALRKFHIQLEIPSCLEYGPKSFNLQGYNAHAIVNVFLPIDTAI